MTQVVNSKHPSPAYTADSSSVRRTVVNLALLNGKALESHKRAAHGGQNDPDCRACRELAAKVCAHESIRYIGGQWQCERCGQLTGDPMAQEA
jgi:hypothetical protein